MHIRKNTIQWCAKEKNYEENNAKKKKPRHVVEPSTQNIPVSTVPIPLISSVVDELSATRLSVEAEGVDFRREPLLSCDGVDAFEALLCDAAELLEALFWATSVTIDCCFDSPQPIARWWRKAGWILLRYDALWNEQQQQKKERERRRVEKVNWFTFSIANELCIT
jgi:hypothetical protein